MVYRRSGWTVWTVEGLLWFDMHLHHIVSYENFSTFYVKLKWLEEY
jgi:hypothetical protein